MIRSDGVRLKAAKKRKESKYSELLRNRRGRLVVAAMEVGGRWSEEAWTFLTLLAKAKAQTVIPALQRSAEYTFLRRWAQMLSVAAQSAFAATPLREPSARMQAWNGGLRELEDVLHDREETAESSSRLQ